MDRDKQADAAIAEAVALTGDNESHRRFHQLFEIAEREGARTAWTTALAATRRRLAKSGAQPLERPGAYFNQVCVKELEKRGIFVPTFAEKLADADAATLIVQSLVIAEPTRDPQRAPLRPGAEETPSDPPPDSPQLRVLFAELEAQQGPVWEDFLTFCTTQRDRLKQELSGMREGPRARLLANFDTPERRLALFAQWRSPRAS